MKIALMFAATVLAAGAQATEQATKSPSTDLSLAIVRFDPPSGSTLKVGQTIAATIAWRYSKPATRVPIWLKLELPDAAPDYMYEGDSGDRAPGEGRVRRHVGLGKPGHVDTVVLVAKDSSSREIYRLRVPVDYTFVADAAHEAERQDGLGSRITSVAFDPPSPAHLAPGARVVVHIGYDAKSAHGVRPVAIPVTPCAMTYNGAATAVDGQGRLAQFFTVGVPCAVRQVRVQLFNDAGAAVDDRLVDVDLNYGR